MKVDPHFSYIFWQYNVYADVRKGSLERGRQMTVGLPIQLCTEFKSVTDRLFTINIVINVIFWITWLCQLIYSITACFQNISHQWTHALRPARHFVNMDASMTLCCNAVL